MLLIRSQPTPEWFATAFIVPILSKSMTCLRKSIGIGLAFQYSRNLLPAVPMARGAFIALVRQLEIATAGANRQGLYLSLSCSILEQGVRWQWGQRQSGRVERTCMIVCYLCTHCEYRQRLVFQNCNIGSWFLS